MDSPRADAAVEACDRHLGRSGPDPEIEAILAQHIAAIAYSEYEAQVRAIIKERCARHDDAPVTSFVGVAALRLVRSLKISDLSGALGWFGDSHKQLFSDAIAEDQEAVAAWNNILTGRHGLAHEQSMAPSLTYGDVKRDLGRARRILDAFESAIAR